MKKILHGGDYNPEQWLNYKGIIDEDFRLFKLAHINSLSVGIFSWASLEPEEGCYEFGWLDDIFDRAAKENVSIVLGTPSGGKPNWLALRYPEIRRVNKDGNREPQQIRHNHCFTSPIYRKKVREINGQLAARYGKHSSLVLWHISNEYNGVCHCELCMDAFRNWLKERYKNIETLNEAYWSRFWSHAYGSWEEITHVDWTVKGLSLDWKRFTTHQCCDFIRNEVEPIRRFSPHVPVTTNMYSCMDYDQYKIAQELDIVSWDSYPGWHTNDPNFDETSVGVDTAFRHDYYRSLKGGKPFLMMETTPSQTNWASTSPLRRPGVHKLHGLQAVAHGSDSVCYFQLRKSRGSCEQFHGAVIDHVGHENTRVFREVSELGTTLEKIGDIVGGGIPAKVAVIFDYDNYWAIEQTAGHQNSNKKYFETVLSHYKAFWSQGIAVDVIDSSSALEGYDLVVAPMLYLLKSQQAERLNRFVECGGTLVATYQTGIVDESTLAFLGGFPGPLRKMLGIWIEEFDSLPDAMRGSVIPCQNNGHGLCGSYEARHYFDLIHAEGAEVLATYGDDFYKDRPAVTLNHYGKGRAYFVASRNEEKFMHDFFGFLAKDLKLPRALHSSLPHGVTAHAREGGKKRYVFIFNFTAKNAVVKLGAAVFTDCESTQTVSDEVMLQPFGSRILMAEK